MKIFDLLGRAVFEIRSLIENSAEVRKMVYYDQANALEQAPPTIEDTREHFTVSPVFDITKAPYDKNTLVSISLYSAKNNDDSQLIPGAIRINVLTQSDLWELSNNKIRPLEIANHIVAILNNRKISSSQKLSFLDIELAILDENVNGYTITFFIGEGSGLNEQF